VSSDSSENAEDDATLIALDDNNEREVGNNEEEADNDGDEDDDIDPSVAESDATIIEEVAAEVDEHVDAPTLTRVDINLGRFSVTIRDTILATYCHILLMLCHLCSCAILPNRFLIVQQFVQISRLPVFGLNQKSPNDM
jgi:hypothetical protein